MGRCRTFLLSVVFVFGASFTVSSSVAKLSVEFPGPVAVGILGDGSCMTVVPGATEERQDVLVGTRDGFLSVVHYLVNEVSFQLQGRTYLGGELVGIIPWEDYQGNGTGVILASREPDLLYFIGVSPELPYFDFQQTVNLPEDPGGMAFGGGLDGAGLELGVTLPGVDQIVILAQQSGIWSIRQTLACGDSPVDLVGIDIDGDQVLEFVSADNGPLSGSLSVFDQDMDGSWELLGQQPREGSPNRLQAWDLDQDGIEELAVGCSDTARVVFLDVHDGQFSLLGSVSLVAPAMEFQIARDKFGLTNLFVSNEQRGLVEFFQGQDFPFTSIDSYYPGCLPKQLAICDFNGDGHGDLAALGLTSNTVTVMFHQPDENFWGYPALPFPVQPNGGVLEDFNGDGLTDLVVSGASEKTLNLFAGMLNGSFEPNAEMQEFPNFFLPPISVQIDSDAALELASIDPQYGLIRVMDYVPGTGFVEVHQMYLGLSGTGLLAADCDGDGLDDLVAIAPYEKTVKIYYGLADGMFTDPEFVVFESLVEGVDVLDLNGDGLLDLVITDGQSRVLTARNMGNRDFQMDSWVNAALGALHIAFGDFDNDGDKDIVIGNTSDQSLSFLENMGDGSLFRRIGSYSLPDKPLGVECVDLNLDGLVDVVVNLGEVGQVGIVIGMEDWQFLYPLTVAAGVDVAQVMVGDFNGDFAPDIMAIDRFLNLGLILFNLERVLVAVEPSALTAQCHGRGLDIDVTLPPADSWSLALGSGGWWQDVAIDGNPVLGTCLLENGRWRMDLNEDELKGITDRAGPLHTLSLRLVVGHGSEAENLMLALSGICQAEEPNLPILKPSWVQTPYPNPFNPSLQAQFSLARTGPVQVLILDARGRLVATLIDGVREAGPHALYWDGKDAGSSVGAGLYFLRISTEYGVISQKIMLLK